LPLQTDDSGHSNSLPRPDLNPVLNRLLGQNMGRWAEVYFTNPPEKREQAVMELLHQLQSQESLKNSSSGDKESQQSSFSSPAAEAPPPMLASFAPAHKVEEHPSAGDGRGESARHPTRYRIFAAVLLVVAVLALAYVAWRSSRTVSEESQPLPTPAAATKPSASPAQAVGPPSLDTSNQISPASSQAAAPAQSAASTSNKVGTNPGPENAAVNDATANAPAETSPPVAAAAGNGSEELATAKDYLNGTGGKARDSGEAAKWLWQAVGKKNAEAAQLLSELYLKGDGVPKSCEQARILLGVAAHRGAKEASEQLRHLEDAGCQ